MASAAYVLKHDTAPGQPTIDGMLSGITSPVRVDHLIVSIQEASPDPLERLAVAVEVASDLDDLSRQLVQGFVERARGSGISWMQIGIALNVSKQAAQKRFSPNASRQRSD